MDRIAVAILNYNGKAYLEKFLPSVITHSGNAAIWVIDNHSTDDSLAFLQEHHPGVHVIALTENGGYSRGYNLGLEQIDAEYFVLLNSDVEVTPNWLEPITALLASDAAIVAAQPKILDYNHRDTFEYAGAAGGYIDSLGYPFCRGRLFLSLEKDNGQYNDDKRIFWATGACLVVRKDIYFTLGGLDEDFFAHMEEIDLCWRINNAGYKIMYCGGSTVHHVGGGTLHKSNPRKTYLNFRNGLSLLYKNYLRWELFTKFPIRICLDIIAALKFMAFDSVADGLAVFKAHWHFLLDLPSNFKKRQKIDQRAVGGALPPIYKGSIVYDYFVRGVRTYRQLYNQ